MLNTPSLPTMLVAFVAGVGAFVQPAHVRAPHIAVRRSVVGMYDWNDANTPATYDRRRTPFSFEPKSQLELEHRRRAPRAAKSVQQAPVASQAQLPPQAAVPPQVEVTQAAVPPQVEVTLQFEAPPQVQAEAPPQAEVSLQAEAPPRPAVSTAQRPSDTRSRFSFEPKSQLELAHREQTTATERAKGMPPAPVAKSVAQAAVSAARRPHVQQVQLRSQGRTPFSFESKSQLDVEHRDQTTAAEWAKSASPSP